MTTPTPRDYTALTFAGGNKEALVEESVLAHTVDVFVDQLLVTLTHYAAVGRLHAKGLSAEDAFYFKFPSALGQRSYPRKAAEGLRLTAYHAIAAYERNDYRVASASMDEVAKAIRELHSPRRAKHSLLADA